jgi:hypothetical protein
MIDLVGGQTVKRREGIGRQHIVDRRPHITLCPIPGRQSIAADRFIGPICLDEVTALGSKRLETK